MKAAIEKYMIDFLEQPHDAFSGLPPCPFARKERLRQNIQYHQAELQGPDPASSVLDRVARFAEENPFLTLIVFDEQIRCSIEDLYQQAQQIIDTTWAADMLAVPVHPSDCFSLNGVETRSPSPTTMLVVQSKAEINKAKAKLSKTAYYRKGKTEDEFVISAIINLLRDRNPNIEFVEIWWTDAVLASMRRGEPMPTPILDSTVYALDRNTMFRWLKRFGSIHGWEPLCAFDPNNSKLQEALEKEEAVVLSGFGGENPGFLALLSKEENGSIGCTPEQNVSLKSLISSYCWVWRRRST